VHQVGLFTSLFRDSRSTEHKILHVLTDEASDSPRGFRYLVVTGLLKKHVTKF